MENGKAVIRRYDPEKDAKPYWQTFLFPYDEGMSVLDVIFYIYEHLDATLTFSYCCRNSHCGLCGAMINGRPGLMCREAAVREMTIEPLSGFNVIRDLSIDRNEYEKRNDKMRLFLDRADLPVQEPELIKAADMEVFKVASRCVDCFCCVSVCPVLKENKYEFTGPANLVKMARHFFDPRDQLNRAIMAYSAGIDNCIECGMCTRICPHHTSPAENIARMKASLNNIKPCPSSFMDK